jgi:class 3 adenylate cyclase/FixJ family two-component response regulator
LRLAESSLGLRSARILIVGQSADDGRVLEGFLKDDGLTDVRFAVDPAEAVAMIDADEYAAIVLDVMQERTAVMALFDAIHLRSDGPDTSIIVAAPADEIRRVMQCIKWGAEDFLTRPFNATLVKARIDACLERRSLRQEVARLEARSAATAPTVPIDTAVHDDLTKRYADASGRFVPREFLEYLDRKSLLDVKLGDHVLRDMTVFFTDIRDFTSLSEQMTPQQNFEFLNSYLQHVNPIIRTNNGFIDKYIGDAIMALFPYKSADALRAAIELQRQVARYNEGRVRANYAPIRIGIGMHRGDLILGTIGEDDRMQTTVIADAVNVASRIEGLTKTFKAPLLVSGKVVDGLEEGDSFKLRHLGAVKAKGKTAHVQIHECYENDPVDLIDHKDRTAPLFASALAEFHRGTFLTAGRLFSRVAAQNSDDGPAAYYRDRCSIIVMRGTGGGAWDGADAMESK